MKQLALPLLLFVLTGVAAQAQTFPITGTVIDNQGNVVAGTTVIVLSGTLLTVNTTTQPGSPLATIYSDPAGTHVINQNTNPVQADGHGNFVTYGAAGLYVVQAYLRSGQQYVWPVSIGGSGVGCISVNGSGCGTNINSTSSVTVSVSGPNITMTATGSGGGCTLPGNNLGLLSEHPAGTCYDSLDATWDDGASKQNLQFGLSNVLANTDALTFTFGQGNNIGESGSPLSSALAFGGVNICTAGTEGAVGCRQIVGFGDSGVNLSGAEVYSFGSANVTSEAAPNGSNAEPAFVYIFGKSNQEAYSGSGSPSFLNTVHILGDSNNTTVSGTNTRMQDIYFVGFENEGSATVTGSNTQDLYVLGELNTADSVIGTISKNYIVGDSNGITTTGASAPTISDTIMLGHSNSLTAGGSSTPNLHDVVLLGESNAASDSSGVAANMFAAGNFETLSNCSDCYLFGENGTNSTSNSIGIGLSATPQEQIALSAVTFSVPITVPTNSFALSFLVNPTSTQMNICGVSGVWAGCVPGISGRTVSGGTDTIVQSDLLGRVTYTNSGSTAVSVTSAASLSSHFAFTVVNTGAGTVTLTPTAGQIGNPLASSMTVGSGFWCALDSWDSANYYPVCGPNTPASGGSGTVTSFSAGNLSPLFTTSVATATTTPALSFSLSTQSANTVFAGPTTGSAAAPTFRALVNADLPAGAGPQGVKVVTSSYTLGASDSGNILIVANCSSACTITLPATQPSTTYSAKVMSVGSTVATIALGGSDTWNGSTNVPVLNSFRILGVNADTTTATNYYGDAPLAAGTNVTFTAATNAFTIAASGGGGSTSLSSITAAGGSNTIANGNNPQTWNWAQTTNSQTAMAFGETTAATGTSDIEVSISTLAGSTAKPLSISDSLSGSQTLCALCITPTWNTTGVVDAGILENVTNTASGVASKLIDLQVGGVTEFNVDKAGNLIMNGTLLEVAAGATIEPPSVGNLTVSSGSALGSLTLTSPAGAVSITTGAGNITVAPAGSANANAASSIFLTPGQNSSTGAQGITQLDQSYTKTGTVAANELLCITTTGYQVQACPTTTAPWIGFGTGTGTPQNVISTGIVQSAPFDTSTVTVGDVACESTSTAGDLHDNGTVPCLTQFSYVGVIVKGGSSSVGDVQIGAGTGQAAQVEAVCTSTTVTPSGTQYLPFQGCLNVLIGTRANSQVTVAPRAMTISNLRVVLSAAEGSGATLAITLLDGSTTEAVTCTVPNSGTTCTDLTHSFTAAAGDGVSWQLVQSGTGTAQVIGISYLIQ